MHADPAPALLRFLQKVPEGSLLQDVAMFPVGHASQVAMVRPASSRHGGVRPQHIPDYLPAFPEPCTYQSTITRNQRMQDEAHAKKKRSQHKRQAQDALYALDRQLRSDPSFKEHPPSPADGIRWHSDAPTAPIRELSSGPSRAQPLLDGASDRLIPDVLLPGQTAVLQASARHECSGLCTDTSRFAAGVIDGAAPIDASPVPAAPSAKRSKQDQILSLKHLHDLDEVVGGDDKFGVG